jgi:hypothetical protein
MSNLHHLFEVSNIPKISNYHSYPSSNSNKDTQKKKRTHKSTIFFLFKQIKLNIYNTYIRYMLQHKNIIYKHMFTFQLKIYYTVFNFFLGRSSRNYQNGNNVCVQYVEKYLDKPDKCPRVSGNKYSLSFCWLGFPSKKK